jgi:hypothetical protein
MWTLDTDQGRYEVMSPEQLMRWLVDLHDHSRQSPVIAMLNSPAGSCLAIGLGHDLSALSFIDAGGWPAKHVIGDEDRSDMIAYSCFGAHSEVPARHAVPIATAIRAAVEFFTVGQPPGSLVWEDD